MEEREDYVTLSRNKFRVLSSKIIDEKAPVAYDVNSYTDASERREWDGTVSRRKVRAL